MKDPLFGWAVPHPLPFAVARRGLHRLNVDYHPSLEGVRCGAYLALCAPAVPPAGSPGWCEALRAWEQLQDRGGREVPPAARFLPGVSVIARLAWVSPVFSSLLLKPRGWAWGLGDVTPLHSPLRLSGPPQRRLWMFTAEEQALLRSAWHQARAASYDQVR